MRVGSKALSDHCKGTVKRRTPTSSGEQEMLFVPEGDIYRLAAKSELPGADEFESWIFDEVLPSIRHTGGYIGGQESMTPDELMAKALMVAQKTLADREVQENANIKKTLLVKTWFPKNLRKLEFRPLVPEPKVQQNYSKKRRLHRAILIG